MVILLEKKRSAVFYCFFSADDRMKYYVTILLMAWERAERQEVGWRRREVTENVERDL